MTRAKRRRVLKVWIVRVKGERIPYQFTSRRKARRFDPYFEPIPAELRWTEPAPARKRGKR